MPGEAAVRRSRWRPSFGSWLENGTLRFRLWAPAAGSVDLLLDRGSGEERTRMETEGRGFFVQSIPDAPDHARYRYVMDGGPAYPDPASRYQPEGPHGPSMVVDPDRFEWRDAGWKGIERERQVIYELHVGTFSPRGTYAGIVERLPYLADLGITVVELMPLAESPGQHNWGYDGVALFAPECRYGEPDDLRRLVDACHRHGLGLYVDVVYNHLGPDGAYLAAFAPLFFSARHEGPWGAIVNLDGPGSEVVRELLVENALYWVNEFHVDGLRLDATHTLRDESERHFLAELADRVHASVPDRTVNVIAEDERNLATIVRGKERGGWGLDGVWADDFHHQVHVCLTGEREGYYEDFTGSLEDLETTVSRGWFYVGQHSAHASAPRGTDPAGIECTKLVIGLQNHDQVGNRARGERLHHLVDLPACRAATALALLLPQTPLLFMGQEWAASTPFLYFTDHAPDLGRLVSEGRRREFARFSAFSEPDAVERIPDPQAPGTFRQSVLRWDEIERDPHARVLALHRALLGLRTSEPSLNPASGRGSHEARALDARTLAITRRTPPHRPVHVVVRLKGRGTVVVPDTEGIEQWEVLLDTEDARYASDPHAVDVALRDGRLLVEFHRPSAVVVAPRP